MPTKLAYLIEQGGGATDRVVVAESGAVRTIVPSLPLSQVDWSPDRRRLALIRPIGATKQVVEIRSLDGHRQRLLSAHPASVFYGLAWSPGGKSVALLVHDTRERGAIEIVDVRTRARRVVAENIGTLGPIDWSPDGDLVAVETTRPHPMAKLAFVNVATGRVTPVRGPNGRSPTFSPDGKSLAYSASSGIIVLELATHRLRQVTTGGWEDNEPAWSPDGRMLVYSHAYGHCFTPSPGPACNFEIFVVSAAGGAPVNLTRTPKTQERAPTWLE